MNEEFFSYRPPTKGHVAHPHGQEQPLGTHTLPDEATNKMQEKMIKKYFLTNSLFRQELIDRREKRELFIH